MNQKRQVKILFLGQCLQTGYESVKRSETYPSLMQSMLNTRFPHYQFSYHYEALHHPTSLLNALKTHIPAVQPDMVMLSLVAYFAVIPHRVSLVTQIAPDFGKLARNFIEKIDMKVGRGRVLGRMIDKMTFSLPHEVKPVLSLVDYRRYVVEAIHYCQSLNSCQLVLMGPGRFNEDARENLLSASPEIYKAVNEMVLELGKQYHLPVVNAQEAMSEHDGSVFVPNNPRYSKFGHRVVAQEAMSVFAAQIAAMSNNEVAV